MQAHYPERTFDKLSPDEQEEVAENAEEPAMEWYLSFRNTRPDPETPSPRENASEVALKIDRLIKLVDFMPDGRSVNLLSCGHKSSTEAFLAYVLIIQDLGGTVKTGFDKLAEIGGSLHILDSWTLSV